MKQKQGKNISKSISAATNNLYNTLKLIQHTQSLLCSKQFYERKKEIHIIIIIIK